MSEALQSEQVPSLSLGRALVEVGRDDPDVEVGAVLGPLAELKQQSIQL